MEKSIKTVIIGADHRGFKLKDELKRSLSEWGYLIDDVGAPTYNPDDDHPDYAKALGRRLVTSPGMMGVLICGSGVGIAVAANKIPGIRAGMCVTPDQARSARQDSNTNVLVLASDYLTAQQARRITKTWLETEFVPKEKYVRRLRKIEQLEKMVNRR